MADPGPSPMRALFAYHLAALVVILDQIAKAWVMSLKLAPGDGFPLLGPIQLTMVWNQGVSFGLLRAQHDLVRWGLVLFSFAVAAALGWWVRSVTRPVLAWGLALIMGGAVGNAIDRIRYGAVVDFVDVSRLMFPWVFNVADIAINLGVACLILDAVRREPLQARS